jgi:hypothetical protein
MTAPSYSSNLSAESVVNLVKRGFLIASTDLEYGDDWSVGEMSRFIESQILDLPTGQYTICGSPRGTRTIIDGLRRITSLCLFAGVAPPWPHTGTPGFALDKDAVGRRLGGLTYGMLQDNGPVTRTMFDNSALTFHGIPEAGTIDLADLRRRTNYCMHTASEIMAPENRF